MPRGFRETVGWVFGIVVVLVVLYAVDGRTLDRLSRLGGDLLALRWSDQLSQSGHALVESIRGQGIEGGLAATFLVVAVLLTWLMTRS